MRNNTVKYSATKLSLKVHNLFWKISSLMEKMIGIFTSRTRLLRKIYII